MDEAANFPRIPTNGLQRLLYLEHMIATKIKDFGLFLIREDSIKP